MVVDVIGPCLKVEDAVNHSYVYAAGSSDVLESFDFDIARNVYFICSFSYYCCSVFQYLCKIVLKVLNTLSTWYLLVHQVKSGDGRSCGDSLEAQSESSSSGCKKNKNFKVMFCFSASNSLVTAAPAVVSLSAAIAW